MSTFSESQISKGVSVLFAQGRLDAGVFAEKLGIKRSQAAELMELCRNERQKRSKDRNESETRRRDEIANSRRIEEERRIASQQASEASGRAIREGGQVKIFDEKGNQVETFGVPEEPKSSGTLFKRRKRSTT